MAKASGLRALFSVNRTFLPCGVGNCLCDFTALLFLGIGGAREKEEECFFFVGAPSGVRKDEMPPLPSKDRVDLAEDGVMPSSGWEGCCAGSPISMS